ncbi:MAG: hypothetical protein ACT452_16770 [Microthrixaceae bacterium]
MTRPPSRSATAAVLAALILASCVQQDPPGLTLSKLEAKLVFGIDEAPERGLTPTEATQQLPVRGGPGLFLGDDRRPNVRPYLPSDTSPDACPPAKNAAAVEFGATDNVNTDGPGNRPVEGVYPWRIMLSEDGGKDAPYSELAPVGFELRAIRNVEEVPRARWSPSPSATSAREVFTFEEVRNISFYELDVGEGGKGERLVERFLITKYLVDTHATRSRVSQTDAVVQLPTTGSPERGISLLSSVTVDGKGDRVPGVDPFEPANGLSLMGLPFVPGETFTASATDASHGTTITNQTVVGSRARLNMCGDLMEGFPSESTQTISTDSPSAPSRAFEVKIWLAPQHGGVSIYESTYSVLTGVRFVLHRASLYATGPVPADGLPR